MLNRILVLALLCGHLYREGSACTENSDVPVEKYYDTTTQEPVPAPLGSPCQRRVCYYTNWSQYRPTAQTKFFPESVDPFLCTHIMYAFSKLEGNQLVAYEWNDESTEWSQGNFEKIIALKQQNPSLKILLALGGWNMGSSGFTEMVATKANRAEFILSAISLLRRVGFDGLDLDWEYPANRGSPAGDKEKYTTLVQELRKAFEDEAAQSGKARLLLTAAVGAGKSIIDTAYDIPAISQKLDFISLMTYDLHGNWESVTGHNSPLYKGAHETGDLAYLNLDFAARYWVDQGCPKNKLVIGMPLYGRTFTLTGSSTGVGAPASDGPAQKYTQEAGYASYYEVCEMITKGASKMYLADQRVPYIVYGNLWVGYDDQSSLREKVRYIRDNGYGGAMVWSLDLDDFQGYFCGQGKFPLLSTINDECER